MTGREHLETALNGRFVFSSVHNIQGSIPVETIEAMFKALRNSAA